MQNANAHAPASHRPVPSHRLGLSSLPRSKAPSQVLCPPHTGHRLTQDSGRARHERVPPRAVVEQNVITVENLTKSFHGVPGSRAWTTSPSTSRRAPSLGVVGPSGAGKSTLARCVALLERPDSGAIRVDGTDLDRTRRRRPACRPPADRRCAARGFAAAAAHRRRQHRVAAGVGRRGRPAAPHPRRRAARPRRPDRQGRRRTPTSSPAGSASGSPWRGRSPRARPCCSPTSRPSALDPDDHRFGADRARPGPRRAGCDGARGHARHGRGPQDLRRRRGAGARPGRRARQGARPRVTTPPAARPRRCCPPST